MVNGARMHGVEARAGGDKQKLQLGRPASLGATALRPVCPRRAFSTNGIIQVNRR